MKMRQYIAFVLVLSLLFGQLNQLHQHHHDEQQPAKHIYSDCSLTEDCSICDVNQSPSLKPSILKDLIVSAFLLNSRLNINLSNVRFSSPTQKTNLLLSDNLNQTPKYGQTILFDQIVSR